MSLFAHIVILASYVLAAFAVAMGLPGALPDVSQPMAYLIAGMVFVGCALLHEVLYRRSERMDLAEDVFDLREALAQTAMEVRTLSDDAVRVTSMLQDAEHKSDQRGELLSEMRVLQTLLQQIAEKSGSRRGPRIQAERRSLEDRSGGQGRAAMPLAPGQGGKPHSVRPSHHHSHQALHVLGLRVVPAGVGLRGGA